MEGREVESDARERIGAALGRITSGAFVVTATNEGTHSAMLASWVQQASFDPPMVTLCVKVDRAFRATLEATGRFTVNIVGQDSSEACFRHFGRGFAPGEDAFEGVETRDAATGPILADAVAHLECTVVDQVESGDHRLYVARVDAGRGRDDAKPYVHHRKSGFSY